MVCVVFVVQLEDITEGTIIATWLVSFIIRFFQKILALHLLRSAVPVSGALSFYGTVYLLVVGQLGEATNVSAVALR